MEQQQSNVIDGGFLQSKHWEVFQRALGRTVLRVSENEIGSAVMIKHKLPLVGGYFFVPRGPVFQFSIKPGDLRDEQKAGVKSFIDKMIEVAKKEKTGWIRVEPQTFKDLEMIKDALHGSHTLVKSKKNHEPAQTLMMDIGRSEDELLAGMKPKTRYNIRLSIKKGVTVVETRNQKDIERFCDLIAETAKRDQVIAHPRSYYLTMLSSIGSSSLKLYVAVYRNEIIAGSLVSFSGGVATYQHGASSNKHRNVMAPYLLQWHAIQDAKQQGCVTYDFGGTRIYPKSTMQANKNSWQGITRFKQGFCPSCQPVEFPGCYDIVLRSANYYSYLVLQRFKALIH